MTIRAGLLTCELRCGHRVLRRRPSRLCSGLAPNSSLTVARQRGIRTRFPVPPQWAKRANQSWIKMHWKEQPGAQICPRGNS